MAMQTGVGLSKVLILVGAGYTGTILFKNGKLSDVLGELQSLVKGLEKKGESSEGDSEYADAVAVQVRRLAMEVRQLASSRQITVLNGGSGIGNATSLIVPAAAVGAMSYGYMWWKGISFSDLMYVTKKNMANAVSNLTKQLEHVNELVAAAKRHLTQRIENVDGKVDEQIELSKLIRNEVTGVRSGVSTLNLNVDEIHRMVTGLDGRLYTLEQKQDFTTMGVLHLCNVVDGKSSKMPEALQNQLKLHGNSRGLLTSSEAPSPKGLKEIADSLLSENGNMLITDGTVQDYNDKFDKRSLMRVASTKC